MKRNGIQQTVHPACLPRQPRHLKPQQTHIFSFPYHSFLPILLLTWWVGGLNDSSHFDPQIAESLLSFSLNLINRSAKGWKRGVSDPVYLSPRPGIRIFDD
ncbi:hypothetical protein CEXT_262041 [Caerostris extrusa]|uniref:Uncharacterized protein n=1 Tax=Caerostris extrusa TaxID=172846 RepID=A0AAV4XU15_CAEEX|nr:hypothetical protein CEXT_262041 [Caerostris extrusa]